MLCCRTIDIYVLSAKSDTLLHEKVDVPYKVECDNL